MMGEETLHFRGGSGAGDLISMLNSAFLLSATNDKHVNLIMHWESDSEIRYHPDDPETTQERTTHMWERMRESDRVTVHHEYSSNMFSMGELAESDPEIRRNHINYRNFYLESDPKKSRMFFRRFEPNKEDRSSGHIGGPDWEWKDSPTYTNSKKIVFWSPKNNKEPIAAWKQIMSKEEWEIMFDRLQIYFPDYDIVEVDYRSDFRDVYELIRDCEFAFGYDGMWHAIPRNFGKFSVVATIDNVLPLRVTNPYMVCISKYSQLHNFFIQISDPKNLLYEQYLSYRYHTFRMNSYGIPSHLKFHG